MYVYLFVQSHFNKKKKKRKNLPKFGSILFVLSWAITAALEFIKHVQLWVKYFLLKAQPLYKIKSLVHF